jgi:hypothetical protein
LLCTEVTALYWSIFSHERNFARRLNVHHSQRHRGVHGVIAGSS